MADLGSISYNILLNENTKWRQVEITETSQAVDVPNTGIKHNRLILEESQTYNTGAIASFLYISTDSTITVAVTKGVNTITLDVTNNLLMTCAITSVLISNTTTDPINLVLVYS